MEFGTVRPDVICSNGCVACSQPLAAQIGLDILKAGGNAADAAVAVAAGLSVTEPCSTGLGGDVFCLFYDSKSKSVRGLNGSGRAPGKMTLDLLQREGFSETNPVPVQHGHAITVPGAAAAWVDAVSTFGSGKIPFSSILKPAIELAETGFPVQKVTAHSWNEGAYLLLDGRNTYGKDMLIDGRAPKHGEVMRLPNLARTLKELSINGKTSFYRGRIATAICDAVEKYGGVMSVEDLQRHATTFDDPIYADYKGFRVWEMPPNGQGIVALMALKLLEGFDMREMGHNSKEYLHHLIEALRLSFTDASWYCTDSTHSNVPVSELLSHRYIAERRTTINASSRCKLFDVGVPWKGDDTVYFAVVDRHGNACSFVNSNYKGFGTGIVPEGCGFTLQNRANGFSLVSAHPNVVAPYKRPYHTIIPAMVTSTETGDLRSCYGVMGGLMQPQGHVQVLLNMVDFHMNPQMALDKPRVYIGEIHGSLNDVFIEDGVSREVIDGLRQLGHAVTGPVSGFDRKVFGRGQVITKGNWFSGGSTQDIYWAGSDLRADGVAIGY